MERVQRLEVIVGHCNADYRGHIVDLTNPVLPSFQAIDQTMICGRRNEAGRIHPPIADANENLRSAHAPGVCTVTRSSTEQLCLEVFKHADGNRLALADHLVRSLCCSHVVSNFTDSAGHLVVI